MTYAKATRSGFTIGANTYSAFDFSFSVSGSFSNAVMSGYECNGDDRCYPTRITIDPANKKIYATITNIRGSTSGSLTFIVHMYLW